MDEWKLSIDKFERAAPHSWMIAWLFGNVYSNWIFGSFGTHISPATHWRRCERRITINNTVQRWEDVRLWPSNDKSSTVFFLTCGFTRLAFPLLLVSTKLYAIRWPSQKLNALFIARNFYFGIYCDNGLVAGAINSRNDLVWHAKYVFDRRWWANGQQRLNFAESFETNILSRTTGAPPTETGQTGI